MASFRARRRSKIENSAVRESRRHGFHRTVGRGRRLRARAAFDHRAAAWGGDQADQRRALDFRAVQVKNVFARPQKIFRAVARNQTVLQRIAVDSCEKQTGEQDKENGHSDTDEKFGPERRLARRDPPNIPENIGRRQDVRDCAHPAGQHINRIEDADEWRNDGRQRPDKPLRRRPEAQHQSAREKSDCRAKQEEDEQKRQQGQAIAEKVQSKNAVSKDQHDNQPDERGQDAGYDQPASDIRRSKSVTRKY